MALASYILNFTVTHTSPTNEPLYIRNESTRRRTMVRLDASGVAIYDLANMPGGYSDEDRIVCFIIGEEYGVAHAHAVDTNNAGAAITITGVDETATTSPEINIG